MERDRASDAVNGREPDPLMRQAAVEQVRRLTELRGHLSSQDLALGFDYRGERIPLLNPRRGIFKPKRMRSLLSIRTVYPRKGAKARYEDQKQAHRCMFESHESVIYSFMGEDPDAADNRWLRHA